MYWSEVFCVVVFMLAGSWFLARSRRVAPPPGSRPSHPPKSSAVLETSAKELEKMGDFDGAMEALLASHSAGSSQAVILAHDLSQRHPGAFQSKGCPVGSTPKPAVSDTTAFSTAGDGGGGGGGDALSGQIFVPSSVGKSTEQRTSERDTLTLAVDRASDVGPAAPQSAGESTTTMGPSATAPPPPPPPPPAENDGQTPWERGWHGPEGFKPPPSDGATVAATATAAVSETISPASKTALTLSVNNNGVGNKRGGTSEGRGGGGGSGGGSSGGALVVGNTASNAAATGLRNFTVAQLNAFDGSVPVPVSRGGLVRAGVARPVYIALKGKVYDASKGNDLYGPGGKYTEFAGHDISRRVARGLAGGSSGKDGSAEFDDLALDGLDRFEQMTLTGWEDMFAARGYPVLGRVVAPPAPRTFSRAELRRFDGRPVLVAEEGGGGAGGAGGGEAGGGRGEGAEGGGGGVGGAGGGGGREGGKGEGEGGGRGQGGCSFQHMPLGYAAPPIYLGVKDKVFDVSFGGSEFYLEGGAYECLAGRDASRVLAKMSMTPDDIEGVLDYKNLTDKESRNLADWVEKLGDAGRGYPVVGWIDINIRE